MKYISIIGSTGSIGTQTLELVRANKDLGVTALAAGSNVDLLEQQIRNFILIQQFSMTNKEQRTASSCKGSRSAGAFRTGRAHRGSF